MDQGELIAYFDPELKGSQILRRYVDLPKFVDFLRTKELYLRQASRFDDHLEGTLPEAIRRSARDLPDFVAKHGDPIIWENKNKDRTYLSCWTLGEKDNMALWKLYGGASQSVAITTTVDRLAMVVPSWAKYGRVGVKKVRYINHAGRLPNGAYGLDDGVFGLKHTAYGFEKEVRIVVTCPIPEEQAESQNSIRVPASLDCFVRSIVVAPEAEDWFFDLVLDITRRYNVNVPVRRSVLASLLTKVKTAPK